LLNLSKKILIKKNDKYLLLYSDSISIKPLAASARGSGPERPAKIPLCPPWKWGLKFSNSKVCSG